jgi:hypothetical protein
LPQVLLAEEDAMRHILVVVALLAILGLAPVGARAADAPGLSPQANATLHDFGEWVKTGAQRLGDAVEQGARDLWVAGKAAVAAADDALRRRQAAREQGGDPEGAARR